jgi:hypothetical protein
MDNLKHEAPLALEHIFRKFMLAFVGNIINFMLRRIIQAQEFISVIYS